MPPLWTIETVTSSLFYNLLEDIAPAERNITPADVIEFTDEDESIHIIGTWGGKVTRIAGLSNMTKIKVRVDGEE